jgi:hypothetical protein
MEAPEAIASDIAEITMWERRCFAMVFPLPVGDDWIVSICLKIIFSNIHHYCGIAKIIIADAAVMREFWLQQRATCPRERRARRRHGTARIEREAGSGVEVGEMGN